MFKQTLTDLESIYLHWFNNYVTIERFADATSLTIETAKALVDAGRIIHYTTNETALNKSIQEGE